MKGSKKYRYIRIWFFFPFVFIINFFMTKVGYILKLSFSQSTPSIHHQCVHFCVGLCLLLCLYLWCFNDLKYFLFIHISPCAFSSFCVILFSSSFSFVWSILPSSPTTKTKTETPLKQKSNSMNGLTKQKKTCTCINIQPTNQNPRAHLRKSSAIAPAPPTSW